MKRHHALAPLSREHHTALLLAQVLKKDSPAYPGLPREPQPKAEYARNLFHTSLEEHFRKEETMLEKVKTCHEEIRKLSHEIISEHQQLKDSFLSLDTTGDLVQAMDVLGRDLERHIRKEERVLFPLIEKHCSEELFKTIEPLLV